MGCRILRHHTFLKLFKNLKSVHLKRNVHQQLDCLKTVHTKKSTLYVPGRQGSAVYQIVKPFVDIDFLASNVEAIRRSCQLRGLEHPPDLETLIPLLRHWNSLREEYSKIVEKDREYSQEIKRLKSLGDKCEDLQKEYLEFIETLKAAKSELNDIEEQVLPDIQMIPNVLDTSTPLFEDVVVTKDPTETSVRVASHTEIGSKMKSHSIPGISQLTFSTTSPTAYYLIGQLSDLERAVQLYFADHLQTQGFHPLTGTDFCKSFVCEATGLEPNRKCIRIPKVGEKEDAQKIILVGGATFEAFCSYLVNMNVGESTLPMRYFAQGRKYDGLAGRRTEQPDLFSVVQSSNTHCLSLCKDSSADSEFESLFASITSCYSEFAGIPRQTVDVAARNLNPTESRRRRLELWSPAKKRFVAVAHASQRTDFVSKRLKVTYGNEYLVEGYCTMVEGVAVNLPVLIGCVLENYQTPDGTFDFSESLKFLHTYVYD